MVVVVLMMDLHFWTKLNNREPTTAGLVWLLEVVEVWAVVEVWVVVDVWVVVEVWVVAVESIGKKRR